MPKVHIKTYGCSNNVHESEVMAGLLKQKGYFQTEEEHADVIILNICTVKGDEPAFQNVKQVTKENPNKKIIVGGCVTKELRERIKKAYPQISLFTTHTLQRVVDVTAQSLANKPVDIRGLDKGTKLLPKIRTHPFINILPISSGCTNHCTFCSVKLIKGNVYSYPVTQIVEEVQRSVADGVKEIYLTSQDTAAYGADTGVQLPTLLKTILATEGNFLVRLGMGNPNHFIKYTSELIEVFKHPKMYKFLHIPVQSGNNRILESMKREYTIEEYKYIIRKFREAIPEITIATDIICGYPTETAEEFLDTLKIIQETQSNIVNISKYRTRKNTPAAKMEQISGQIKRERATILSTVFKEVAYTENLKWIGWEGNIIINEAGRFRTVKGRNYCYRQMIINGTLDEYPLGSIARVKVVDASAFDLYCEVLPKKVELKVV